MKISIIGGGHGCYAAAAHLSETGHDITLWRRDSAALRPLAENRALTLTDWQGTRVVSLAHVTSDLGAAVIDAALILLPLPATTQADLATRLAPHLRDDQVLFLPPGTFGGILYAQALRAVNNPAKVMIAETGTLPYLARKQGPEHVRISVHATRLPTGVYPASRSSQALEVIAKAYPAMEPLSDLLDGALMNAGPIIHPPLIMMNAGPLQHFDAWDIHNEGTQPAIRRVTDALDNERIAIRERLGYGPPHFPLRDHYDDTREEWMYGNASHARLTNSGDWREKIDLESHRYMREDTALGLSFLVSLGRRFDVPTPIAAGFLSLAGAITGEDLYAHGRTLENLGLNSLDKSGLQHLLYEGLDHD